MTSEPFLNLRSLASALGLPRAYLRDLADRGLIPTLRIGRLRRFDAAAVRKAVKNLSSCRVGQEKESNHAQK
ncbi:MAG TPA: excisionase family DNA-binding protein [Phycisphaerae bacterium]|nr:excisionase family DNA-binding protein [Phycisphaerae bacterium]